MMTTYPIAAADIVPASGGVSLEYKMIPDFLAALAANKAVKPRTVMSYASDLEQFRRFIIGEIGGQVQAHRPVNREMFDCFRAYLDRNRYAASSIVRKLVVLRAFARFLSARGFAPVGESADLRGPKLIKREWPLLEKVQIQRLLAQVDGDTCFGARDLAILHLLCLSGLRAGELVNLKVSDVQPDAITICRRVVSVRLGIEAGVSQALAAYLGFRTAIDRSDGKLFVNRLHGDLKERSILRILDKYAVQAGLGITINPNMVRRSLAANRNKTDSAIKQIQLCSNAFTRFLLPAA